MPCSFVTPAKGHQKAKRCREPEFKGGFCQAHQPPPPTITVTPVTLSWAPMVATGTTVNPLFQNACEGTALRIEGICSNGIHAGGMSFTGTKGSHQLLHETQPGANNTIFYRWVGNVMMVYGVGGHTTDNKHYSLTWYDGSTVAVSLPLKQIGGKVVQATKK